MTLTNLIGRIKVRKTHKNQEAPLSQDKELLSFGFWLALVLSSLLIGSACAFFLWSLNGVTDLRAHHPWLFYLLPLGGFVVGMFHHGLGRSVESGNNLVLDEFINLAAAFHAEWPHWFSSGHNDSSLGWLRRTGRDGGANGWQYRQRIRQRSKTQGNKLSGVINGRRYAPKASGIFAVEVLAIGGFQHSGLIPCLIAAYIGDWSCQMWHIFHTHYDMRRLYRSPYTPIPHLSQKSSSLQFVLA